MQEPRTALSKPMPRFACNPPAVWCPSQPRRRPRFMANRDVEQRPVSLRTPPPDSRQSKPAIAGRQKLQLHFHLDWLLSDGS